MTIPIIGEIEKLINEHGSATILKERIALANDKYSALEKELSASNLREEELKSENQRLKSDNIQLRQEIQRHDDILQKEKSHDNLLNVSRMKWGCITFPPDNKLYCPSCFHAKGKKIENIKG
jgi:hypothetical protein